MVLELLLLGQLTLTAYRSVPEQTDDSPNWTSIGEHTAPGGCAVSQDLLRNGTVTYGDYLYIEGQGLCRANDTMHPRISNSVDLWVTNKREESRVGKRRALVYKVRIPKKVVSTK